MNILNLWNPKDDCEHFKIWDEFTSLDLSLLEDLLYQWPH
jgi:hypothetical protein